MRRFIFIFVLLVASPVAAETIATSIKPVHSLVAMVLRGIDEPVLLIRGSPHGGVLKPSQMRNIANAQRIFMLDAKMETVLSKPVDGKDNVVYLMDSENILIREVRLTIKEDDHDDDARHDDHDDHAHHDDDAHHDDHDDHAHHDDDAHHDDHDDHAHHDDDAHHDDHDDHAHHDDDAHHDDHDDHAHHDDDAHHDDHDDHAHHDDDAHHDDHDDHAHHDDDAHHDDHDNHAHHHDDPRDFHIWLDTDNARAMLIRIRDELLPVYPDQTETLISNTEAALAMLDQLDVEIAETLSSAKDSHFLVFHDAYQYLEKRYGLKKMRSILDHHNAPVSASRLQQLEHLVKHTRFSCIFAEPQFDPKLANLLAEISGAGVAVLDPIGETIEEGPDHYPQMLRSLASAISTCS